MRLVRDLMQKKSLQKLVNQNQDLYCNKELFKVTALITCLKTRQTKDHSSQLYRLFEEGTFKEKLKFF